MRIRPSRPSHSCQCCSGMAHEVNPSLARHCEADYRERTVERGHNGGRQGAARPGRTGRTPAPSRSAGRYARRLSPSVAPHPDAGCQELGLLFAVPGVWSGAWLGAQWRGAGQEARRRGRRRGPLPAARPARSGPGVPKRFPWCRLRGPGALASGRTRPVSVRLRFSLARRRAYASSVPGSAP